MAEFIDMSVSGRIEIKATTIKPTMYFDKWKFSANLTEYLVARVAPFITRNNEKVKIKKLSIRIPFAKIFYNFVFLFIYIKKV